MAALNKAHNRKPSSLWWSVTIPIKFIIFPFSSSHILFQHNNDPQSHYNFMLHLTIVLQYSILGCFWTSAYLRL